MNLHRAFVAARWLVAGGAGAWTARQFFLVGRAEGNAVFGGLHALYGFGGLIGAVVLIPPELVDWVTLPLNRLIDAVLMPSESEPPPVDYTLARFYHSQRRFDEACDEYLKIIQYHPRELLAYLEGMAAAGEGQRTDLAAKFHRFGVRTFRNAKARKRLHQALEGSHLMAASIAETAEAEAVDDPVNAIGESSLAREAGTPVSEPETLIVPALDRPTDETPPGPQP